MNFHKFCLTLILSISSLFSLSQTIDSICFDKISSSLKISYNSSIIYPGTRIGAEFPIIKNRYYNYKDSKINATFVKDRLISINLSWYHHSDFHDNLYLTAGYTMRRAKSKGFMIEFSPEIGMSRTFLGGTTYKVDNNGNVTIEKLAGYYYALISACGGIGYDFSMTTAKPYIAFIKINLLMMFPYNSTIYLRPAMEIGIIYKPPHFLSLKVNSKSINLDKIKE
jgi:hypothetical protein